MTLRSRCRSAAAAALQAFNEQTERTQNYKEATSVCLSHSLSLSFPLSHSPLLTRFVCLVSLYLHKSPSRMQTPIRVTAKQTKVSIKGQSQQQPSPLTACPAPTRRLAALNGLKAVGTVKGARSSCGDRQANCKSSRIHNVAAAAAADAASLNQLNLCPDAAHCLRISISLSTPYSPPLVTLSPLH